MPLLNTKSASPTQKFLEVDQIKDDVAILKNGELRAIIECSSLNFALKSEEEQNAITYAYQNFLNSLDFSLEFVIHSRKLDISEYLIFLEEKQKTQENELLKLQTTEYLDFIKSLTELANIMSKKFYVIIPFAAVQAKELGFADKLTSLVSPPKIQKFDTEKFKSYKDQLIQRVDFVKMGIRGMGIVSEQLTTEQLIKLFYELYNPGEKIAGKEVEMTEFGV